MSQRDHAVHFFHYPGSPSSALAATALARIATSYDVRIVPHTVPRPDESLWYHAPAREKWEIIDSRRMRLWLGLPGIESDATQNEQSYSELLSLESNPVAYLEHASGLHTNETPPASARELLKANAELQRRKGHYDPGMVYFAGEWFDCANRLSLLQRRFRELGLGRTVDLVPNPHAIPPIEGDCIEFFFSFRSPYSYLAFPAISETADKFGLDLKLRPVLPLAMRNHTVSTRKALALLKDAARESRELGIPFGYVRDPLGTGVENALAVFHSLDDSQARQFAWSALSAVWARAIKIADEEGIRAVANEAGLEGWQVDEALNDTRWKDHVERNRRDLLALNLWGVPSFRVGSFAAWGQDRIPMLAAGLQNANRRD